MKQFAFISRHTPTSEQHALAAEFDIELVHIGDTDAFTVGPSFIDSAGAFEGVVVVHPAAAMRLCSSFEIGIFENESRPGLDQKPHFLAKKLWLFDLID